MSNRFLLGLRERMIGDDTLRARRACDHARRARHLAARADAERFREEFGVQRSAQEVFLARAQDTQGAWYWARLPEQEFFSRHSWVSGATGSGKTFLMLSCLQQVLSRGRRPVIIVDCKGELAALVTRVLLPALAMVGGHEALFQNLRIIRPFDRRFTPELRLTLPEPDVPREVQAFTIASAIEEALDDALRARMSRMFLHLVSFAIERNLPLTVLQQWLAEPATFMRDARGSQDPLIRQYAAGAFVREAKASVDALLARLDTFLFLKDTRRALSAPRCVSFAECLDSGLTIVDLGDPPVGAERAAQFWAGVLVGRLTRAILSRRLRRSSPGCWVLLEEFQEAITGRQGQQFARLLSLSRHRRVALTFINQQVAQLDPSLVRILRTNTSFEAVFRSSYEDARLIAHALPVSVDDDRSARQHLLEEIPRLPNRTFYLWAKSMAAQRVRSPRVDLDRLTAIARTAPPEVRQFIRQGTVAVSHRDTAVETGRVSDATVTPPEAEFLRPGRASDDTGLPRLG